MKKMVAALLAVILIVGCSLPVLAADQAPTDTFTHWIPSNGSTKVVVMRPVYEATEVLTLRSLDMSEDVGTALDMDCDEAGNIYVLTDAGNVVMIDAQLEKAEKLTLIDADGMELSFSGAKGIYVHSSKELYIADTKNARVLLFENRQLKKNVGLPESSLIPSDFVFQPVKVGRDRKGYLYVLSDGSYYGALLYDPQGEFVGFYGANTVKGTILTSLSYIWDRLTQNDIKRAKTVKTLPYQFADICIDDKDFVYTCTGKNVDGSTGQIRMLSPGGTNILSGAESKNFGESDRVLRRKEIIKQNFNSIAADGQGFIYALDSTYGLVYLYDTDGNLISSFGGGRGMGEQKGTFSAASAIAVSDSRIFVADAIYNSITVFERTEYGALVMQAQQLTMESDYLAAEPLWNQVLQADSLNRLAMQGLAKAAYKKADYETAMRLAKSVDDVTTYSQALKEVQNATAMEYFGWLFAGAIVLLAGVTTLVIITIKRRIILIRHNKSRLLFSAMIHPFSSFGEIKYKKQGSLTIAVILTILFFVTGVMATTMSDFRYTTFDKDTYNALFQLAQTVGLILLWTVANWAVSTLQQGIGKLREVFIVTAYSVLPMILYNLISTPLSHVIVSESSTLISGLNMVALILTGIMLCIGLMIIHDFSFPRFLVSAIVTVLLMILIVFVLFMIGILLSQCWSIFSSIFLELIRL